jgi:hypothetical protein
MNLLQFGQDNQQRGSMRLAQKFFAMNAKEKIFLLLNVVIIIFSLPLALLFGRILFISLKPFFAHPNFDFIFGGAFLLPALIVLLLCFFLYLFMTAGKAVFYGLNHATAKSFCSHFSFLVFFCSSFISHILIDYGPLAIYTLILPLLITYLAYKILTRIYVYGKPA